jgi:hypothetical protein
LKLSRSVDTSVGEIAASAVAEYTAADTLAAVDIRAGESAADNGFVQLFAVNSAAMVVERMIALVVEGVGERAPAHVSHLLI